MSTKTTTRKTRPAKYKEELVKENLELRRKIKDLEKNQTEREKRLEKENKQRYYSLFSAIADPVFIYDAATFKFLHCNEAALSKFGYSRDELLNMTPFDLHKPEDFEEVRKHIDRRNVDTPNTYTQLTKDSREKTVEITTEEIYFDGNAAWMSIVHDITERIEMEDELHAHRTRLEAMVNDRTLEVLEANKKLREEIQERKKAEVAIRESETKLRNIIEKSLDGVLLVDEKGSIIEWSSGQEKIFGTKREMVVGKKIWEVEFQFQPQKLKSDGLLDTFKNYWQEFFKTGVNPFQDNLQVKEIERPNGMIRNVQQLHFPIETDKGVMMACTTRDITDRLNMENQLAQSQKMEAMGTLAGGIAHDFNNILGGIMGYTELATRKLEEKSPVQKYLTQVMTASRRASDLVKQILTFSRKGSEEKEAVLIAPIVKEAVKLLRSSLPATIEIISKITADNVFVMADPTQIHQVIMNLCTNAAHAMRQTGGVLEVRLNPENLEDGTYEGLKPGPHLRLSVSDTGHGIPLNMQDKIFEPFFTTKEKGEGTGMGLAVVHGIVQGHNGHISVYSKEGDGTTFSILLPIVVNAIQKPQEKGKEIPRGNERVLLVEDDKSLADAESDLLEELGYHVTKMNSSVQALELFKKIPDRFDIVITDYIMPKKTGTQIAEKILELRPEIPIILCTGYSDVITDEKAASMGLKEIINKPIDLAHIANSMRRLLDQTAGEKDGKKG